MVNELARIYKASSSIIQEKIGQDTKISKVFEKLGRNDVVVVRGECDRVEEILDINEIPYMAIESRDVENYSFSPEQIIFINCPGIINIKGIERLQTYIINGGCLSTTDWGMYNILQSIAFEGIIEFSGYPTQEGVVNIDKISGAGKILSSIKNLKPIWKIENNSYPIKIIRPDVEILMASSEMKKKYGHESVAVAFKYGKGKIFHTISHFKRQKIEEDYKVEEGKLILDNILGYSDSALEREISGISGRDLQNSYASIALVYNIILEGKTGKYNRNNLSLEMKIELLRRKK